MARVAGVDPGTVGFDLCGLDGERVILDRSLPTDTVAADPDTLIGLLSDAGPFDLIAGPSGYGLPLVSIDRCSPRDLTLAALLADGLAGGTRQGLVVAMQLRGASGSVLDHLYVEGAERIRQEVARRAGES